MFPDLLVRIFAKLFRSCIRAIQVGFFILIGWDVIALQAPAVLRHEMPIPNAFFIALVLDWIADVLIAGAHDEMRREREAEQAKQGRPPEPPQS